MRACICTGPDIIDVELRAYTAIARAIPPIYIIDIRVLAQRARGGRVGHGDYPPKAGYYGYWHAKKIQGLITFLLLTDREEASGSAGLPGQYATI